MATQNKAMTWAGWGLTGLVGLGLCFSAVVKLANPPAFKLEEEFSTRLGYPMDVLLTIGILELVSTVLFLIPRTAVLGAVLLTGYLGGAIATHVRIHDIVVGPAIGGVLVWLALYLRDARIRALLPLRSSPTPPPA